MNKEIETNGYRFHNKIIPNGCYPLWYISDSEYNEIIIGKNRNINPSCSYYFQPIEYLSPDYIIGNYGILDVISKNGFANENGIVETNPILITNYYYHNFFDDYRNQKDVYFTFDRITLWKLVNVIQTKPLQLTLKQIERRRITKKNTAFMMMPFGFSKLDSLYYGIKDYLKSELDIIIRRADELLENDIIIETIYREIEQSEFLIADTTKCNKNVFYEIGYADALNKNIISIQDFCEADRVYFDKVHKRHLDYHRDSIESFYTDLKYTIEAIRKIP